MNRETLLLEEIRALHAKIDSRLPTRTPIRHGWLKLLLHDLEYNPHTQYRVHIVASYFWVVNLPFILALFIFFPDLWLQVGVFITLLYSLYANLATDYGAASSALAAMGEGRLPEIPTQPYAGDK